MLKLLTAVSAALALQQTAPAPPPVPAALSPVQPSAATPAPPRLAALAPAPVQVQVQEDSPFLGVVLGSNGDNVVISEVVEGTAAESAGLLAGDVLLMAGGVRIEEGDDLLGAIGATGVGGELTMVVQRGGQAVRVEAVLGTRAEPTIELAEPAPIPEPVIRRSLAPVAAVERDERPFLGVNLGEVDGGALVTGAIDGTAAGNAGLLAGDLITRFGGARIDSTQALIDAVGGAEVGEAVVVEVQRDGDRLVFEVELGARPSEAAPGGGVDAFRFPDGLEVELNEQLGDIPDIAMMFENDGQIFLGDGSGEWQALSPEELAELEAQWEADWGDWAEAFEGDLEEWAEGWDEDEWVREFDGNWDENAEWVENAEWAEEWESWAEDWADDMGQWTDEDWEVFGEGFEAFGEDMEDFGEQFEDQFEELGEQLEEVFENFEDEFEASMEFFGSRMDDHAQRFVEHLEQRSEFMLEDFENRLDTAPRPSDHEAHMLGREVEGLANELDRMTAERDAAVDRAAQLESELAGVRTEVAELRAEVRALIGYLEELRSDG